MEKREKNGENPLLMSNNPRREHAFYRSTINHVTTQKMNDFRGIDERGGLRCYPKSNCNVIKHITRHCHSHANHIPLLFFFSVHTLQINLFEKLSVELCVVQMSAYTKSLLNESNHMHVSHKI